LFVVLGRDYLFCVDIIQALTDKSIEKN